MPRVSSNSAEQRNSLTNGSIESVLIKTINTDCDRESAITESNQKKTKQRAIGVLTKKGQSPPPKVAVPQKKKGRGPSRFAKNPEGPKLQKILTALKIKFRLSRQAECGNKKAKAEIESLSKRSKQQLKNDWHVDRNHLLEIRSALLQDRVGKTESCKTRTNYEIDFVDSMISIIELKLKLLATEVPAVDTNQTEQGQNEATEASPDEFWFCVKANRIVDKEGKTYTLAQLVETIREKAAFNESGIDQPEDDSNMPSTSTYQRRSRTVFSTLSDLGPELNFLDVQGLPNTQQEAFEKWLDWINMD